MGRAGRPVVQSTRALVHERQAQGGLGAVLLPAGRPRLLQVRRPQGALRHRLAPGQLGAAGQRGGARARRRGAVHLRAQRGHPLVGEHGDGHLLPGEERGGHDQRSPRGQAAPRLHRRRHRLPQRTLQAARAAARLRPAAHAHRRQARAHRPEARHAVLLGAQPLRGVRRRHLQHLRRVRDSRGARRRRHQHVARPRLHHRGALRGGATRARLRRVPREQDRPQRLVCAAAAAQRAARLGQTRPD
mmetsp:Transcript_15350/g.38059  ORF Transcript_15350/g.38059 Transcript_15350/m.38059 type:complete len:245 (-) Transcript_15350:223-957(-)